MVDTEAKTLEFRFVDGCKMYFSWIFRVYEEKLTKKIHTTFLYACNQRSRRIGEYNGKSFIGFSKTKKKKKQID